MMKNFFSYANLYVVYLLSTFLFACTNSPQTLPVDTIEPVGSTYPTEIQDYQEVYPVPGNFYIDVSELKPPTEAHSAEPGKSSISGLIYVPNSKSVVKNTVIYLVQAEGENKDQVPGLLIGSGLITRGDIVSRTEDTGVFYIDNIPPGNYFLVVSFQNDIVIAANSETNLAPRLFKFEPDTSVPLGLIVSPGD